MLNLLLKPGTFLQKQAGAIPDRHQILHNLCQIWERHLEDDASNPRVNRNVNVDGTDLALFKSNRWSTVHPRYRVFSIKQPLKATFFDNSGGMEMGTVLLILLILLLIGVVPASTWRKSLILLSRS
jgi:hypothetical protein